MHINARCQSGELIISATRSFLRSTHKKWNPPTDLMPYCPGHVLSAKFYMISCFMISWWKSHLVWCTQWPSSSTQLLFTPKSPLKRRFEISWNSNVLQVWSNVLELCTHRTLCMSDCTNSLLLFIVIYLVKSPTTPLYPPRPFNNGILCIACCFSSN